MQNLNNIQKVQDVPFTLPPTTEV